MSVQAARGLVAVGDSITRAAGQAQLGLQMQSWAMWLAEALALPYTCLARDGASTDTALLEQVPRLRGPYDLGCLYLGVNDVRTPGFDAEGYEMRMGRLAGAMSQQCALLLLVCPPARIGVPPAPEDAIARVRSIVEALAREHDTALVMQDGLRGPELLLADMVHLTARGQAWLGLQASRALAARGLEPDTTEIDRALEPLSTAARLRYLLGAHAASQLRDWRRRLAERGT